MGDADAVAIPCVPDRRASIRPGPLRREATEALVLETAARLFAQRGFAGTSLQDIADAVGFTRPALYYYVKSKDELLRKLVTDAAEEHPNQINDLALDVAYDAATKLARISYLIAHDRAVRSSRFLLLMRSEAELPDELAAIHEAGKQTVLHALIGVIEKGIENGQFRPVDPHQAAFKVIGMCNWVAWWFREDDPSTAEEVATDVADLAVGALNQVPLHVVPTSGIRAAAALIRRDIDLLEHLLDEDQDSSMVPEEQPDIAQ